MPLGRSDHRVMMSIRFLSDMCGRFRGSTLFIVTASYLVLSACSMALPGGGEVFDNPSEETPEPRKALSRATLGKGDIILEGPRGWCIEPSSLNSRRGSNFASLAGCHALTEGRVGSPVPYGILTVAVSAPRPAGDVDISEALAQAVAGERILSTSRVDGVALVHIAPTRATTETGLGDPQWRGVFVQGRRVVALAAYGPQDGAIAQGEGGTLLIALANRIRELSGGATAPVAANAVPGQKTGLDLGGAIGRLLNRKVSE